ncbi:MAG: hypothetical protein ACE5IK_10545 [Acidobacteriota bacterium]
MNHHTRRSPGSFSPRAGRLARIGTAAAAAALLLALPVSTQAGGRDLRNSDREMRASSLDSHEDDQNACSATTRAAFMACKNEARDDYWIAVGNCRNVSDSVEGAVCLHEARQGVQEAMRDCADQEDARGDVCDALGEAPYDPQIDPADFVDPTEIGDTVDPNPFFPLVAGVRTVFLSETEGERTTVSVTRDTREILGVTCVVVNDVVSDAESGEVLEDTDDYYAQALDGTVWYFGETAIEFEHGDALTLEGSWKAGREMGKAGIIMEAAPAVGDVYRQEFFLGDAEDLAEVLALDGSESVPFTSCSGDCLVTRDFTPLEPDVSENKFYKAGIGVILEFNPDTGGRVELIEMSSF